jgi:MFS family permease
VCDFHGRKSSVVVCGALFTLGGVVLAASVSYAMLLCGRFLVGAAIGWSGFSVTVYVTEVSPNHLRGTLVAINELTLCGGCLLAFLCGWLLDTRWRWMFGLSVPAAGVLTIGALGLPESPRWLVMQSRFEEALTSLQRVRGDTSCVVAAELSQLKGVHEVRIKANAQKGVCVCVCHGPPCPVLLQTTYRKSSPQNGLLHWYHRYRALVVACVQDRTLLKCVAVSIGAGCAQNFAFSNAVLYYGNDFIVASGVRHAGAIR